MSDPEKTERDDEKIRDPVIIEHGDYRALIKEAKKQLESFNAQIDGIHRISNIVLIKKSQNELYQVSDDLPLEMSISLMEIADSLKNGLIKIERSLARFEARLDMMEDNELKERYR